MDVLRLTRIIVNLLQFFIIIAQVFIIYILKKAKLTRPIFFLILLLSLFDLLFVANGILYGLLFIVSEIKDNIVALLIRTLGYVFHIMSLQITIFIIVCRKNPGLEVYCSCLLYTSPSPRDS